MGGWNRYDSAALALAVLGGLVAVGAWRTWDPGAAAAVTGLVVWLAVQAGRWLGLTQTAAIFEDPRRCS